MADKTNVSVKASPVHHCVKSNCKSAVTNMDMPPHYRESGMADFFKLTSCHKESGPSNSGSLKLARTANRLAPGNGNWTSAYYQ